MKKSWKVFFILLLGGAAVIAATFLWGNLSSSSRYWRAVHGAWQNLSKSSSFQFDAFIYPFGFDTTARGNIHLSANEVSQIELGTTYLHDGKKRGYFLKSRFASESAFIQTNVVDKTNMIAQSYPFLLPVLSGEKWLQIPYESDATTQLMNTQGVTKEKLQQLMKSLQQNWRFQLAFAEAIRFNKSYTHKVDTLNGKKHEGPELQVIALGFDKKKLLAAMKILREEVEMNMSSFTSELDAFTQEVSQREHFDQDLVLLTLTPEHELQKIELYYPPKASERKENQEKSGLLPLARISLFNYNTAEKVSLPPQQDTIPLDQVYAMYTQELQKILNTTSW